MEVTLAAVSDFGVKINGDEKWTNFDKKSGITDAKKTFHNGDVVNVEKNSGGFITSMTVVTAAPPKAAKSFGGGFQKAMDPEKSMKMARGAAVKAVMDSPIVFEAVKDMNLGEAMKNVLKLSEEVAKYIEKGI